MIEITPIEWDALHWRDRDRAMFTMEYMAPETRYLLPPDDRTEPSNPLHQSQFENRMRRMERKGREERERG